MAGQDLPTKEKTCRLLVSWRLNFLHSTMMKGMIENGARAGIKETYETFKEVGVANLHIMNVLLDICFGFPALSFVFIVRTGCCKSLEHSRLM